MKYYTKNSNKNYYKENESNTNCGSFALNIKEWYEPDRSFPDENWVIAEALFESGDYTDREMLEILLERSVEGILKDFDGEIRRVPNELIELKSNEELIAFRIGTNLWFDPTDCSDFDVDFHFRVFRDGRWQEKYGSGSIQDCEKGSLHKDWETSTFLYEDPTAFFVHTVS